jgi:hypothetical protein
MLMAARQPGLASVYDAILGFEGDEFYLKEWPELHSVMFKDLPLRFPHAVALGIKKARDMNVMLNPSHDTVLEPGDELLVLARDDDSYSPTLPVIVENVGQVPSDIGGTPAPEVILMCGWRRDVDDIIKEMDNMVVKGSQLHMLSEVPISLRDGMLEKGGLSINQLRNLTLVQHFGNSAVRRQIEDLPLDQYDSILILADEMREADMMHSDSHSLASLLLIRDIQKKRLNPKAYGRSSKDPAPKFALGKKQPMHQQSRRASVGLPPVDSDVDEVEGCLSVCEVLDHRTRYTIRSSRSLCNSSDFVQSNEFVSRVLAMVAERKEMKSVLVSLLGSGGTSLCVNAPIRYVHKNEKLSFYSMALRVQAYQEILCGYKQHGREPILNPNDKHKKMRWDDVELIVMANEDSDSNSHGSDSSTSGNSNSDSSNTANNGIPHEKEEVANPSDWCVKNAVSHVLEELQVLPIDQKKAVLDRVASQLSQA